jgi:hypothetical protein
MFRPLFALAAVALLGGGLIADEKKEPKKDATPTGVWMKESDGLTLILDFTKADVLTVTVAAGENSLIITNKMTVEKDGTIKGKMTKSETKGEFPVMLKDGYEMSFKFKVDGKTAKLSDFTASEHEEQGKGATEGEYSLQEKKDK